MNKKGILIIDLEKTCWQTKEEKLNNKSEIIQIGVVDLDFKTLNIKRKKSILIKTEKSVISEYCENLTGINDYLLKREGINFEKAINILEKEWGIANKKLVFWGNDYNDLENSIKEKKLNNKLSKNFFNFANFYSHIYYMINQEPFRNIGLRTALTHHSIDFIGNQHNAIYDALNTAILYKKIMKNINL